MLVPAGELSSLHTPRRLADHVTRFALAALGAGPTIDGTVADIHVPLHSRKSVT